MFLRLIKFTKKLKKSLIELNPLSAKNIEKLDNILYSMEEFTLENKTKHLIAIGENKTTEFKSTLSYDQRSKQKNKDLEHSCLKTIVAFLNSQGGALLIGVSNDQKISGLDEEIKSFTKE